MPNRQLREGLRTSEQAAALTDAEFRLFILLLTSADDFGRFHADPRLVCSTCFPFGTAKPASIKAALDGLRRLDFIKVYVADGREYMEIQQWDQRRRCNKSKYPDPKGFQKLAVECPSPDRGKPPRDEERGTGDEVTRNEGPTAKAFAVFWKYYPRKEKKKDALKAFEKAVKAPNVEPAMVANGARRYADVCARDQAERRHIALATSWLNAERWNDEYKTGVSSAKPSKAREDKEKEANFERWVDNLHKAHGNGTEKDVLSTIIEIFGEEKAIEAGGMVEFRLKRGLK